MGIADRDYARVAVRPRRAGRMAALSVNTWLIVINIAVFIVANMVLARTPAKFTAGLQRGPNVSQEQLLAGVIDRSVAYPIGNTPYFGHPIYDRTTKAQIGIERVVYHPVVQGYGHFSTGKALELQVWRFLTFQFLHASPSHLIFNMLGLWFMGSLVEAYLGRKRYLAFYLLSGIAGATLYMILNAIGYGVMLSMPSMAPKAFGLLFNDAYTPLVGASAGVFGVLMAGAYVAPDEIVDVMYVIPMRLKTAVYIFVALATANLIYGGSNAGGDAAHVGGALAGYFFIRRTHLLRDFFQLVGGPSRKQTVPVPPSVPPSTDAQAAEIDRILDKVREDGLASLTDEEKQRLHRASNRP